MVTCRALSRLAARLSGPLRVLPASARSASALGAGALAATLLVPVSATAIAGDPPQTEPSGPREERALARQESRRAREEERAARRQARVHAREGRHAREGSQALEGGQASCQVSLAPLADVVGPGEAASLQGQLTCAQSAAAAGQQVTLFQHQAGTPGFHSVASSALGPGGAYQLTLSGLTANSVFYARVAGVRSTRVRIGVEPAITLQATASSSPQPAVLARMPARAGAGTVTFSGTVTPAYANATVVLQRAVPGARGWRRLGRATLSAQGTYALTHRFPRTGRVQVRAVVHHRGTQAATSETVSYMTPARQNPRLTIEASASPLTFGQAVTISGTLAGGPSRRVALLARTAAGFTQLEETMTDAHGAYSFPAQTPLQTTLYRVDSDRTRSIVLREWVAYQLDLAPPPAEIPATQPLTLTGAVTPAAPGQIVFLERQGPALLGFHPVASAALDQSGGFSITHVLLTPGTVRLRVTVPNDPAHLGTSGSPFSVRVTGHGEAPPAYQLFG
jgi:hypothetical protein